MNRLIPLLLLASSAPTLAAQIEPGLSLHGLAPGASRSQLEERVGALGGRLRCRRSTADPRLAECVANIARAPDHRLWALRASMVNGVTAILLLTTAVATADAERLRDEWTGTLGEPIRRTEPGLESCQWSRGGRTMRLTAHEAGDGWRDLSVSLVQTAALASLGRAR